MTQAMTGTRSYRFARTETWKTEKGVAVLLWTVYEAANEGDFKGGRQVAGFFHHADALAFVDLFAPPAPIPPANGGQQPEIPVEMIERVARALADATGLWPPGQGSVDDFTREARVALTTAGVPALLQRERELTARLEAALAEIDRKAEEISRMLRKGHELTARVAKMEHDLANARQAAQSEAENAETLEARLARAESEAAAAKEEAERFRFASDKQAVAWKDRATKAEGELAAARAEIERLKGMK